MTCQDPGRASEGQLPLAVRGPPRSQGPFPIAALPDLEENGPASVALQPDVGLCARISPERWADLSSHRRGICSCSLSSAASPFIWFSRAFEELRERDDGFAYVLLLGRGVVSAAVSGKAILGGYNPP